MILRKTLFISPMLPAGMVTPQNKWRHIKKGGIVEIDDEYQFFTDMFFDMLWNIEDGIRDDETIELFAFALSELRRIEEEWRYPSRHQMMEGWVENSEYVR
jgi:hypothetical protein